MNINITEVDSKKEWDSKLMNFDNVSFLQSWEWGDFQRLGNGKKVLRTAAIDEDGSVKGMCQFIEEQTSFGEFLYSPRGPVVDWSSSDFGITLTKFSQFAKEAGNYILYRSDPNLFQTDPSVKHYDDLGFRSATNFVQVQRCWVLDISDAKNEEDLFKIAKENGMSKSIPRHIRKSAKNGVTVRVSDDPKEISILIDMLNGLARKKGIPTRPDSYYEEQFKALAPAGYMKLFIAEYEGRPISTLLVSLYGQEVATLHGSTVEDISQSLYVAKRIYWEAIKYASENGYTRFNYWGVLSEDQMNDSNHPSFGYSLFKRRMGGKEEMYMDTKDLVFKRLPYFAISSKEKYRKIKYKVD
jgi:lipid II:glycine glycyltransferase (peptidoglycan interpeptide bridge formation enzyme)